MKKGVLAISLFIFLISFSFVAAENLTKVGEAYSCLRDSIEDRGCDTLSSEERFFSLLALNKCEAEVLSDSVNNECWPSSSCNVKSTAQAILSLDSAGQNTDDAQTWLLNQKKIPIDMIWYLQVESTDPVSCSVDYDSSSYPFTIGENKKIDRNAGPCLTVSNDNPYWFRVSASSQLGCYEKEFIISCSPNNEGSNSFLTTLLFTKENSPTIYVTKEVNTAPAGGDTIEKVNSFCFSTRASCDYEGSLWSALVLDSQGKDVSAFMPYLVAMAEDNPQYLPESFLYSLTADIDYRIKLLLKQKASSYWRESGDRFYDTALALLPFQNEDPVEKINSKEWLLSPNIQDENGCWEGNIRNTAFVLNSIWPSLAPRDLDDDNGGNDTTLDCINSGYYCTSSLSCDSYGGNILDPYSCSGFSICCSVGPPPGDEFCSDRGGIVCSANKNCVDGIKDYSVAGLGYNEVCCIAGTCEAGENGRGGSGETFDCEVYEGVCRSSGCGDNEEESARYSCEFGDACCVEKLGGDPEKAPKGLIWIFLILIILAVLGILFSDRLRRMLFRFKSRGKSGSGARGPRRPRPPEYPAPLMGPPRRMPMPQRFSPSSGQRPRPRLKSQGELDDVLKKLKDMGR